MKSKLALVLALAAVLAVPAAYAKEKDPSSPPPGQAKKEEGQQPPGQAKQEENADADDSSAQQQQSAQPGNDGASAAETPAAASEPPGQAKKQTGNAPPGQAKKKSAPKKQSAAASSQAKQSSHVPPGQAKKTTTHVPPGQAKKESGTPAPVVAHSQNNGDHGAPKGKITICHATQSATNPYVEITINVNGMHGHGHHDDIVPAPGGGCPSGNRAPHVQDNTPPAHGHAGKITICHATHSATNPYVEITISVNGMNGHDHHDDIVPAPAGGCPGPQARQPVTSVAGGPTTSGISGGGGSGPTAVEAASASTAAIPAAAAEAQGAPTSGVAGVQALSVGSRPLPAKKSGGVLGTVTRSKLPFTGLPLLPFVLGGLLAIILGTVLVRRRATRTL